MTLEEFRESIDGKLRHLWETSQYAEAKSLALTLLDEKILYEDKESLAKVYNVLGNTNLYLFDYNNALTFFLKALQIFEDTKNKFGSARIFGSLGLIYKHLSDYPLALEYYQKAVFLYEEIGHKLGIANNFGNIGNVYNYLSNFPKALEYFLKSLQINEEIQNFNGIGNNLGNIGNVYAYLKDYSKAIEYYQKALSINEKLEYKEGISNNLGNIGIAYNGLSDYSKAIEYLQKSIQINEKINNKSSLANNFGNLGNTYHKLSNYNSAFEFYQKALKIDEELENKQGIAVNLVNLGSLFASKEFNLFDQIKAEEYLFKSIALAKEIGTKDVIKEAYNSFHLLYLQQERYKEALEFQTKAIALNDEIISSEAKKQAENFDLERKNSEREKQLAIERTRFQEQEKILHNILPVNIADRILKQETFIADHFQSVSVLFMDLVGFTSLSSIAPPKQLVYLLDTIFTKADEVVERYGLEKIKTIGDGYLAVANVTTPLEEHQKATAKAGLKLLETMQDFTVNIPTDLGDTDWINNMNDIEIRIGIHTGEVVAGIIGKNKYTYDLWGDAVNIASRMESNSEAGRIHISEEFAMSIKHFSEFSLIPRGEISIKGKGTMKTFWLEKGNI